MKLGIKLALIYGLIILCTITAMDILLIESYRRSRYAEIEPGYSAAAGILSVMTTMDIYNTESLKRIVHTYGNSIRGRILILNSDSVVLADSFDEYDGRRISNKVLNKALHESKSEISYHELNDKKTMMCSAPVYLGSTTAGAVLISAYVQDVEEAILKFIRTVVVISGLAALLSCTVALLTGKRIIKPVKELTKAAALIHDGKTGVQVVDIGRDEIGTLAQTFNTMSSELHKMEAGRRAFLSKVSHELKTPLASIKALIESLIDGDNSIQTYKEYLADVNCEIDRLTGLVGSLLTIERLEEIEIKKEKLDVHREILDVCRLLKALAERKNICLLCSCDGEPEIFGDRNAFREMIINLVDNSIKYGRENGYVRIGCEMGNDSLPVLVVEDNGIGIPEDSLPQIFNNFSTAGPSGTGGSGVGLYIVKRLADFHGWSIKVASKAGEGTRFEIHVRQ